MCRMLEICYKLSLCCDFIFNFIKSEWAYVGKLQSNGKIEHNMGNYTIPQCNRIVYLDIEFKFASSLSVN